ncbi:sensor histidine kinase [Paenibacillus cremeus]|uniref:HAMP domain-containing protein n=1 Tax=Paenibacillus cremeus TaxID=2163881 RepID=A0A559KA22_9BACL|nr:histidine kinase [Paenibacillus cremeus]TVY08966.1 HAMP domain-containing protein [Paenibacillus cremeus]
MMSRCSIRVKLIVILLAATLTSILLTGAFSQYFYTKAARNDFFQFADDASYRLNRQIELYIQQMKISVSSILAGPLPKRNELSLPTGSVGVIQRWLMNENPLDPSELANLEDVLNNYVALNYSEVDSMFLMSLSGRIVSNVQRFDELSKAYLNEPWYAMPMSGTVKVVPTHRSEVTGKQVISLLVPVYSLDAVKLAGRLVINLRINELEKTIVRSSLAKKGYFFIVAKDGTIVYHPDSDWIGKPIASTGLSALQLSKSSSSSVQKLLGEEMLVSYSYSELAEWNVVAMVPFAEMASGITVARNAAIVSMLILALVVLILVPIFTQRFIRPLRRLKQLMEHVEKGNLEVRAEVLPGKDEIQLLSRSYNRMTDQLSQLIETVSSMKVNEMHILLRQKEAKIQALQNQINPHLLYNTLAIISSIAYVEKNERIQVITKNLGDYYRYTASIVEPFVTLREEIDQLKKYLQIIKIRFPKYFQSHFYVNEKYLDARIVKCSLQPIVENAIKYAVEPKRGHGTVIVSAYNEADNLIIEIADNGGGIEAGRLAELQERLKWISSAEHGTLMKTESVGIVNVHARLVLQYGPAYGVSVTSFEHRGTVVSIKIPYPTERG